MRVPESVLLSLVITKLDSKISDIQPYLPVDALLDYILEVCVPY